MISDDITWYTSNSLDLGFDFNTLGERLAGSFDYFYMKTTGYLTSPSNVGYTDPLGLSLPKVKSDGEHRRAGCLKKFNILRSFKGWKKLSSDTAHAAEPAKKLPQRRSFGNKSLPS